MADADAVRDAGLPGPPDPGARVRTPRPRRPRRARRRRDVARRPPRPSCATASSRSLIAVALAVARRVLLRRRDHRDPAGARSPATAAVLHGPRRRVRRSALKISLVVGIILAMPVILYQVWAFVAPGPHRARAAPRPAVDPDRAGVLRPRRRHRVLRPAVRGHVPARVLERRPPAADHREQYFDFVTTMFLAFGLVMEFPILLFGLSRVTS